MADWQRKLDIKTEWEATKTGEMTIQSLAAVVAHKLAAVKDFGIKKIDDERRELAEEFRRLSDGSPSAEDFDDVWDRLYNWADTPLDYTTFGRKVCWIGTF